MHQEWYCEPGHLRGRLGNLDAVIELHWLSQGHFISGAVEAGPALQDVRGSANNACHTCHARRRMNSRCRSSVLWKCPLGLGLSDLLGFGKSLSRSHGRITLMHAQSAKPGVASLFTQRLGFCISCHSASNIPYFSRHLPRGEW